MLTQIKSNEEVKIDRSRSGQMATEYRERLFTNLLFFNFNFLIWLNTHSTP